MTGSVSILIKYPIFEVLAPGNQERIALTNISPIIMLISLYRALYIIHTAFPPKE
jgi:hypothetical protein